MLLGSLAQRAQGNGQPPQPLQPQTPILNARQTNGTAKPQETDAARLLRIETQVGQTMLYEYFVKGDHEDNLAEDFAAWMFNGMPEDYLFVKRVGAPEMIRRAKSVPQVAAIIGPKEPQFVQFMTDVCAWNPDADEPEQPTPPAATTGVTFIDPEEQEQPS